MRAEVGPPTVHQSPGWNAGFRAPVQEPGIQIGTKYWDAWRGPPGPPEPAPWSARWFRGAWLRLRAACRSARSGSRPAPELQGKGIVLVLFQMRDGFLVFLLVHQRASGRAMIRALNHAVAAAVGHSFQLLQSLVGQRLVARAGSAHGAVAQDARHLLIAIGLRNRGAMAQALPPPASDVSARRCRRPDIPPCDGRACASCKSCSLACASSAISRNSLSASA